MKWVYLDVSDFVVKFMFLCESMIMIKCMSEMGAILCEYLNCKPQSMNVC